MLIKRPADIPASEITDQRVYLNRRAFIAGLGGAGATFAASGLPAWARAARAARAPRDDDKPTPYETITTYNNYYEFGTDKGDPARYAGTLRTRPWTVRVDGEVHQPQSFDIDAILKRWPAEEHVYRHRCVEAWSIVVPWDGFPLSRLLNQVQPTSNAKFVKFTTLYDPRQMPGQNDNVLAWPYVEGLRLDEAMHPLTLLATGLYGTPMPNQDGAPIRLVVPWKYGFKSIKSIVRITLVRDQPDTTWNLAAPNEYGFYSNVNPNVDHPRWSQARERRLGEFLRRPTLLFNGYGDQVASLYTGMDLRANY